MMYIVSTLIFVLSAVQGRLVASHDSFEALMQMALTKPVLKDGSCVKAGQCYIGTDPANECCGGHAITDLACMEGPICSMCEAVLPTMIKSLTKEGCLAVIPEGVALCELAGLGPEDPLADICAVAVAGACPLIATLVSKGITSVTDVCTDIGLCGQTSSTFGQRCDCVGAGHCTYYEQGCCSGSSSYSWSCFPPLSSCN